MAYIEREKMLTFLEENNADTERVVNQYNADWIYRFIESQPAADVVEVKHGEWITDENSVVICSECGEEHEWQEFRASYCDMCGAKMDGGNVE